MTSLSIADSGHDSLVRTERRVADIATTKRWTVSLHQTIEEIGGEWQALAQGGGATVFQQMPVISALFDAVSKKRCGAPLIALVRDRRGSRPAAIFPMTQSRKGLFRWLKLADCGVIDYGVPLFDRMMVNSDTVNSVVKALAKAVPADGIYLNKMPAKIASGANPFAALPHVAPLALSCWHLPIGDEYETKIRKEQSKSYRKNSRRRTRQLAENHDRQFDVAIGDEITPELVSTFFHLHEDYRASRGRPTLNSENAWRSFYDQLVAQGSEDAKVFIATLKADCEVIAMDFGLVDRFGPTPMLTGMVGGDWSHYAPGLQVMEEYFAWFGAKGYPRCDLSIGDYPYKKSFRAEQVGLYDLTVPASLLGRLAQWAWMARTRLRTSPTLRKLAGKA